MSRWNQDKLDHKRRSLLGLRQSLTISPLGMQVKETQVQKYTLNTAKGHSRAGIGSLHEHELDGRIDNVLAVSIKCGLKKQVFWCNHPIRTLFAHPCTSDRSTRRRNLPLLQIADTGIPAR